MVIFLYGEDTFRSRQKLKEIKQKYLASDKSGSGLSSFDCEEKTQASKIINVLGTPNLLAPKRLVIVENIISNGAAENQKELLEFLKRNKESVIANSDLVLVFREENAPKKSNVLFKFLAENSKKQEFEKLNGLKLEQWIVKRIKEKNKNGSISKGALSLLLAFAGNDIYVLDGELEKLVNFSSGRMIGEKDVEMLVKANISSNIFLTIDALGNKNKKEALSLLYRHMEQGEDPFYIFSMFLYQFRNLLKVADLKERNMNEYEIGKITKLHPFVIKKSFGQLRNFSLVDLTNIYKKLGDLDTEIKTGKIDIKLALDKFIAEI
ncbi:MAG TPA: DNA polymerase III subunit delta [Candidatus Moranbacteria bacterium]|mgnify:CR=1 FL=1|nr:DNA polymerase III subunit delta [Candidatus Moranbacteria bacterium]